MTNGSSIQQRKKPFPESGNRAPPKSSIRPQPEHILWNGSLYNGTRFLANVNIVSSYKSSFVLPIIGSTLSANSVVKLSSLKRILPDRIFRQGSSNYHVSKATLKDCVYLSCGIKSSDKQCPVIDMLASHLQRKEKAIKIDFNSNEFACLLPDCELAQKLGLVFNGTSYKLFCLFVDKSKGTKTTAQPSRAHYQIQQRLIEKRLTTIESIKKMFREGVPSDRVASELKKEKPGSVIPFTSNELQQILDELMIVTTAGVAQLVQQKTYPSSKPLMASNTPAPLYTISKQSHSHDQSNPNRIYPSNSGSSPTYQTQVSVPLNAKGSTNNYQIQSHQWPPMHSHALDPRIQPYSAQVPSNSSTTNPYKPTHISSSTHSSNSSPKHTISKSTANSNPFHEFDYQKDMLLPMWFENVIQDVQKEGVEQKHQFTSLCTKSAVVSVNEPIFTTSNKEPSTTTSSSNWLDWYKSALPSNYQSSTARTNEDEIPVVTMYQSDGTTALNEVLPLNSRSSLAVPSTIVNSLTSNAKVTSRRPSDPRLINSTAKNNTVSNSKPVCEEAPKLIPVCDHFNKTIERNNSDDMELSSLPSDDESQQIIVNNFTLFSNDSTPVEVPPLPEDFPKTTDGRPPLPPDESPKRLRSSDEMQNTSVPTINADTHTKINVNHAVSKTNSIDKSQPLLPNFDMQKDKSLDVRMELNNEPVPVHDTTVVSNANTSKAPITPTPMEDNESMLFTSMVEVVSPEFVPPREAATTTTTATTDNTDNQIIPDQAELKNIMPPSNQKINEDILIDIKEVEKLPDSETAVFKQPIVEPISSPELGSVSNDEDLKDVKQNRKSLPFESIDVLNKSNSDLSNRRLTKKTNGDDSDKIGESEVARLSEVSDHVDVTLSGERHISLRPSETDGKPIEALSVTLIAKKTEAVDHISSVDSVSTVPRVVISASVSKKSSKPLPISPDTSISGTLRRSPRRAANVWENKNDLRNSISPRPMEKIRDLRDILNKKVKEKNLSKHPQSDQVQDNDVDEAINTSLSPNLNQMTNERYSDAIVSPNANEQQVAFSFEPDTVYDPSDDDQSQQSDNDLRTHLQPPNSDDDDLRGHLNSLAASISRQSQNVVSEQVIDTLNDQSDSNKTQPDACQSSDSLLNDRDKNVQSLKASNTEQVLPDDDESKSQHGFEAISDDEMENKATETGRESPPIIHLYDAISTPDKVATTMEISIPVKDINCDDDSQGAMSSSSVDTSSETILSDDSGSALDPHRMVLRAKAELRCQQGDMELSPSLADQPSSPPFDEILTCQEQQSTVDSMAMRDENILKSASCVEPNKGVEDSQTTSNQDKNMSDNITEPLPPSIVALEKRPKVDTHVEENISNEVAVSEDLMPASLPDNATMSQSELQVSNEQSTKVISVSALSVYLLEFKRQWLESHPNQEDICNNLIGFLKDSILR